MNLRGVLVTVGAAAALAACERPGDRWAASLSHSSGRPMLVAERSRSGGADYVRRIDSDVTAVFREEILPGSRQTVVQTGMEPGFDQSSLLVLDAAGRVLLRHRVSGDTPEGYRHLTPGCGTLAPQTWGGRRWLLVPTGGLSSPYSIEVLEIRPDRGLRGLVPRLRIWVDGSPHAPVFGDGKIAFRALANSFRRPNQDDAYPVAICVVAMEEAQSAARDDVVRDVVVPLRDRATSKLRSGTGFLRYFVLGEWSRSQREAPFDLRIEAGAVHATREDGLTYVLDFASGACDVHVSGAFAETLAQRGTGDDGRTPSIDAEVLRLRGAVEAFSPAPR